MDIQKIIGILESLEKGALTPEQGIILLEIIIDALEKMRPTFRKFWLRIIVDGVKVSLAELKEHLEEIQADDN